jgi:hypothetical protein
MWTCIATGWAATPSWVDVCPSVVASAFVSLEGDVFLRSVDRVHEPHESVERDPAHAREPDDPPVQRAALSANSTIACGVKMVDDALVGPGQSWSRTYPMMPSWAATASVSSAGCAFGGTASPSPTQTVPGRVRPTRLAACSWKAPEWTV